MALGHTVRRTKLRRLEQTSDVAVVNTGLSGPDVLRHPKASALSALLLAVSTLAEPLHRIGEVLQVVASVSER